MELYLVIGIVCFIYMIICLVDRDTFNGVFYGVMALICAFYVYALRLPRHRKSQHEQLEQEEQEEQLEQLDQEEQEEQVEQLDQEEQVEDKEKPKC